MVLIGILAALVLASVYTSLLTLQCQTALQQVSRYNSTWLASQAVTELVRFQERVAEFALHGGDVDADEVRMRFDMLANRVNLMRTGEVGALVRANPEQLAIIDDFDQLITNAAPLVDDTEHLDTSIRDTSIRDTSIRDTCIRLLRMMDPLVRSLSHLAATINQQSGDVVARYQAELGRLHLIFSALTFSVVACAVTLLFFVQAMHTRIVRQVMIAKEKEARDQIRASEASYRDLSESARDAMMVFELPSGTFISANSSALRIFGAAGAREFFSHKPWEYSPERQPDGRLSTEKAREMIETALREGSHLFEWVHARWDGTQFPSDVLFTSVIRGNASLIYSTVRDTTERKNADERIARMAHYDGLTGLANRSVFIAALERNILWAGRCAGSFAVLYLDLDHFKDVNDTLGHSVGDVLLRTVAERLQASVRPVDIVARFGGDEFAVLVSDIKDPANAAAVSERVLEAVDQQATPQAEVAAEVAAEAAAVAVGITERIVTALTEPFTIENNRIHSGASVGIAIYGPDSPDAESMLAHADLALYRAKAEQRGSYRFFSNGMDAEVRARVSMGRELREALASDQFVLMYQPQVEILTGRIVGLEALVRWFHPTLGMLGPVEFIPEAERNGLIVPLGRWIMREACRQARQWLDAGTAPPLISVNVSSAQFRTSFRLEEDIAATVAEFRLPPRLLELELTESVLMEASRDHNGLLSRLRAKGHRIVIDDFGTGYSSLDYLRRYPVDRIKIAQTFIADIGIESGNDAIVRAGLGLARELNIEVVVEGVETADQLQLLQALGARIVQGYYFARPMPAGPVSELLRVGKIMPAYSDTIEIAI